MTNPKCHAGLLPGYTPTRNGMLLGGVLLPDSLIKDGQRAGLTGLVENKVIYGGVSIGGDNPALNNCAVYGEPYDEPPQDWRAGRTDNELLANGYTRIPDFTSPAAEGGQSAQF